MDTITHAWPGGISTIAGGTRSAINLSRPWQQPIKPSDNCPFCAIPDKEPHRILGRYFDDEWFIIDNLYSPYPGHKMIIPRECWEEEKLRLLGGQAELEKVFAIVKEHVDESKNFGRGKNYCLSIHVGQLAGQNITHPHFHLIEYFPEGDSNTSENIFRLHMNHPELDISEAVNPPEMPEGIVIIGGYRAGQCLIGHVGRDMYAPVWDEWLHITTANIAALYAEKFRSRQGLSPDFALSFLFGYGAFHGPQYGLYTPILNHWGGAEYLAMFESPELRRVTLPWPHELTAKYLRGEELT